MPDSSCSVQLEVSHGYDSAWEVSSSQEILERGCPMVRTPGILAEPESFPLLKNKVSIQHVRQDVLAVDLRGFFFGSEARLGGGFRALSFAYPLVFAILGLELACKLRCPAICASLSLTDRMTVGRLLG